MISIRLAFDKFKYILRHKQEEKNQQKSKLILRLLIGLSNFNRANNIHVSYVGKPILLWRAMLLKIDHIEGVKLFFLSNDKLS